jgi:hypothetical protein
MLVLRKVVILFKTRQENAKTMTKAKSQYKARQGEVKQDTSKQEKTRHDRQGKTRRQDRTKEDRTTHGTR